jgi:ABC-2 type transport system permease protein
MRNRFFPAGTVPVKSLAVILFGLLICLVLYLVSLRVVGYFHRQSELGFILSLKIFQMAWIIMFAMLIFSCMVSSVSTLFLSPDNEIIFSAPVSPAEIYFMRYVTTTFYTPWMTVIFSLPVFGAYGKVFQAGVFTGR